MQIAAVAICLASPALAYRTGADLPELASTPRVRWYHPEIHYRLSRLQAPELDGAEVAGTVRTALETWSLACGGVTFVEDESTDDAAVPGDGINTIQWIDQGWAERGYADDSPGITNVQYARLPLGEWAIVEADIYLNAESFTWTLGKARAGERELGAVVTHEGGHALGLLHPCEAGGVDGAPDCESQPAFEETTMYPFYGASQSSLEPDDEAGACFLYPKIRCGTDEMASLGPSAECARDGGASFVWDGGSPTSPGNGADAGTVATQDSDAGPPSRGNQRELGETCENSNDCAGGECLRVDRSAPVCTRRCDAENVCSEGWVCRAVDSRDVCVPVASVVDDGCSVTGAARSPLGTPLTGGGVLAAMLFAVVRRRRSRRMNQVHT